MLRNARYFDHFIHAFFAIARPPVTVIERPCFNQRARGVGWLPDIYPLLGDLDLSPKPPMSFFEFLYPKAISPLSACMACGGAKGVKDVLSTVCL